MPFNVWHYEIDTLPRLVSEGMSSSPSFTLRVPLGMYPIPTDSVNVFIDYQVEGQPPQRVTLDLTLGDPDTWITQTLEIAPDLLTAGVIDALRTDAQRQNNTDAIRPYLEVEARLTSNRYVEGKIRGIPAGKSIKYQASVYSGSGFPSVTPQYTIYAVSSPPFVDTDICYITYPGAHDEPLNVVYFKEDADFHHFRVDYVDVATSHLDFALTINDAYTFRLACSPDAGGEMKLDPSKSAWMPTINPFHDYVILAIPKALVNAIEKVVWLGHPIDPRPLSDPPRARIMLIQFCTQGLNDLFTSPNRSYTPPRSYMEITLSDERSAYSSRPDSPEGNQRDGYIFTLQDHRRYGIRYIWAFNGGVLELMANDTPDEIRNIQQDILSHLMDPAVAGFGGHALPYFERETNDYALGYGNLVMNNILGKAGPVYYLDQRLYIQIPQVVDALKGSETIKYIVTDGATGYVPHQWSIKTNPQAKDQSLDWQYLWRDEKSGKYILFIDDEMRDGMVGSSDDEYVRGKLALNLRQKFFSFASQRVTRKKHLMIYGDDVDKASGNGWFDGVYTGRSQEIDFCDRYKAALEWIADHTWIHAITSADLNPDDDCVGTIDMRDAISAPIDPNGSLSLDQYGKTIHYDAWYDSWKDFRSEWLDRTLEEVSQAVEYAILAWPRIIKWRGVGPNDLYRLAQMAFAVALQESQWNKQPVERLRGLDPDQRSDVCARGPQQPGVPDDNGLDANGRKDVCEPEDFVIAETLQVRNAQVYLNAAVWADWAVGYTADDTFFNGGPVVDIIKNLKYDDDPSRRNNDCFRCKLIDPGPSYYPGDPNKAGLHWDRDILPNVILYNRSILLVMDQNGGRITHIFVVKDGTPYCISGTMKDYQFLSDDEAQGSYLVCDGEVLQNTVSTPNHAYVANDLLETRAAGVVGTKYDPRSTVLGEVPCYYPDNFNSYLCRKVDDTTVEWRYTHSDSPAGPMDVSRFRDLLKRDRQEKLAGAQGVVQHPRPDFAKTIALEGEKVRVTYSRTQPGHLVANELCVDLLQELVRGVRHTRDVDGSEQAITFRNTDGTLAVTIRLTGNCSFSGDTLLKGDPDAYWEKRNLVGQVERRNLRLQRVLTDCVEVLCEAEGDFSYEITVA